jgi:hypothetical protein
MLDQVTAITEAGLRGDVEVGLTDFDEAYRIARVRN